VTSETSSGVDTMPGAQIEGADGTEEMPGQAGEMPSGTPMTGEDMPGTGAAEESASGDGAQAPPEGMGAGMPTVGDDLMQAVKGAVGAEPVEPFVAGPRAIVPVADFTARGLEPIIESPPSLQYHGGPVIQAVEVIPIYWGAEWATGTNAQLATQLDGFFDFIVTSSYIDMLAEYSIASTPIQPGSVSRR